MANAVTSLTPSPVQRFVDSNGNALSGGKLFTYSGGTTTKLTTYTDSTGTVAQTNPIILNTRGEPTNGPGIWLTPGLAYKFVLAPSTDTDPPTNPIWTVDNVQSPIPPVVQPQGRLTLTSATPYMTAGVSTTSSIFYTPYLGNAIPIWNGSTFVQTAFSQLTMTLTAGAHPAGTFYDIFVYLNAGVVSIGTGPAWTNTTTRSAAITQTGAAGIWTNTATISLVNNGVTTAGVAANQATYVGSVWAGNNGNTTMQFKPAAGSTGIGATGIGATLGLWNAYNRLKYVAQMKDVTVSWTNASATWTRANGATTSCTCGWIDGLGQSLVLAEYIQSIGDAAGSDGQIGVTFDSNTNTPAGLTGDYLSAGSMHGTVTGGDTLVSLGQHFVNAMERAAAGTATFYGGLLQMLRVTIEM